MREERGELKQRVGSGGGRGGEEGGGASGFVSEGEEAEPS